MPVNRCQTREDLTAGFLQGRMPSAKPKKRRTSWQPGLGLQWRYLFGSALIRIGELSLATRFVTVSTTTTSR